MEWKVGNALSRDVERQHLNKILAEIRAAINSATTSNANSGSTNTINTVTRYAVARFTLNLTGAVEGSALVDGTSDVELETTLSNVEGFVEEAPIDSRYYWRRNGEWRAVPLDIAFKPEGYGFVVQVPGFEESTTTTIRQIEVEPGELTIADGDGQAGNPTLGLEDTAVTPGSYSSANIEVDQKGRIIFAEDGTGGGGSGGILPMVTGDVPPELVYLEDGSLVYFEVA